MDPDGSKARKCLFGRPDHKQLESDLKRELNKDVQEMNEKYDFDFQEGNPLKRTKWTKYEWVEVNEPPKENEEQTKSTVVTQETENTENKEITRKNPAEEPIQHDKTPAKNLK